MAELVARAEMLVRRPATEVFNAWVQPEHITRFWLKSTTGPLAPGAQLEWEFMVPGATEHVRVTAFDEPHRIAFTWADGELDVDIKFSGKQEDTTVVSVEARGFEAEGGTDEVVNATEGFSIVLCDLKIFLETGYSANLVKDKAGLIQAARDA